MPSFSITKSKPTTSPNSILVVVFIAVVAVILGLLVEKLMSHKATPIDQTLVPHIHLEIAPQYAEKLKQKREQARALGILLSEKTDYVPVHLTLNGQDRFKAKARLKGDWADHIGSGKPSSFRVKVKGENAVLGMRVFSIQHISTRYGHAEYLLLRQLREHGILTPRHYYARFSVNTRNYGIMVVEEHFTKEMLEAQQRRESVIVALNEDPIWQQRALNRINKASLIAENIEKTRGHRNMTQYSSYALNWRVFQQNKTFKNPALRLHYEQAVGLLRGYMEGWIGADKILDEQLFGRYSAIMNAWQVRHGFISHNMRVYYNPVSRLFEPISFDNDAPHHNESKEVRGNFLLKPLWFSDKFRSSYINTLREIKLSINNRTLEQQIRSWEKDDFDILLPGSPGLSKYNFEMYAERVDFLLANVPQKIASVKLKTIKTKTITSTPTPLHSFINAFWIRGENENYLEIQGVTTMPVEIIEVWYETKSGEKQPIPLNTTTLPINKGVDEWLRIPVNQPDNGKGLFKITARLKDYDLTQTIEAIRYAKALREVKYASPAEQDFLQTFPFVTVHNDSYMINPGKHSIKQDFIVPQNRSVVIQPGTELKFSSNARFVCRTAIQAVGTKLKPIILKAENQTWPGMIIISAEHQSNLSNVTISGVKNPESDDWGLTGAVTFFQSPVNISDTEFINNDTEDALNIIKSDFVITESKFQNTPSDAIDIDFGQGEVSHTFFENIGGDALDVSGSNIQASQLNMNRIFDKAISVGENSTLQAQHIYIKNTNIGIASKDKSNAVLIDSKIDGVETAAYMAYIKKPEYGSPVLTANNNIITNAASVAIAIPPAQIIIDGKAVSDAKKVNRKILSAINSPLINDNQ